MISWLDIISNPDGIIAIFGDEKPILEGIDLHEIVLHRDGPRITFRFDLPKFPSKPQKKWQLQGYNCIQLQLMLIGVFEVMIKGWSTHCKIDLVVKKEEGKIYLGGKNSITEFYMIADELVLININAYLNKPI
jgi:hypothetical protein